MEFCPVCMLRKALAGDVESGESSASEDSVEPTPEQATQRFKHYQLAKGEDGTDSGPIYGREAIEKHFADMFNQVHFSNFSGDVGTENSAHLIATRTSGAELWRNGNGV